MQELPGMHKLQGLQRLIDDVLPMNLFQDVRSNHRV
jgi:hypothetical protein